MYIEGDLPYVGNCNNNGNSGWGDWSWIVGLAIIGALFGNGGFGFGGGFGRGGFGGFGGVGYGCFGTPATQADLANGFAQNTIQRGIDDIILGQAQQTNFTNQGFAGLNTALANGFAGVQQTLCQGFNGIDRAIADTNSNLANSICTLGYQNQAGFNALANQLASCCCDLKTMNLESRYLNEKQTCDIVSAINAGNQRLVDIYTSDKLDALRTENAALKGQISNERQSAQIIDALSPKCPQPAYVVQPPQQVTFPTNCCGNVAYASYNNGCGCGFN